MRTELEFNHETGIVTTRFLDPGSIEEVVKSLGSVITHKEYTPGMKRIYDITHANLSEIDGDMVEKLSIQIENSFKNKNRHPMVALVSENALNYGTVSLFKEYYKGLNIELVVFESLKKAEDWLSKG
jgi:hypothetical protein